MKTKNKNKEHLLALKNTKTGQIKYITKDQYLSIEKRKEIRIRILSRQQNILKIQRIRKTEIKKNYNNY